MRLPRSHKRLALLATTLLLAGSVGVVTAGSASALGSYAAVCYQQEVEGVIHYTEGGKRYSPHTYKWSKKIVRVTSTKDLNSDTAICQAGSIGGRTYVTGDYYRTQMVRQETLIAKAKRLGAATRPGAVGDGSTSMDAGNMGESCVKGPNTGSPRSGGATVPTFYCNNFANAPVFDNTNGHGKQVNTLYETKNWFVCYSVNARFTYGVGTNTVWLYTQGDKSTGSAATEWGWVPAAYIMQGGQNEPVPGVPPCK